MIRPAFTSGFGIPFLTQAFPLAYIIVCLAALVVIGIAAPTRTVVDLQLGWNGCFYDLPDPLVVQLPARGRYLLNGLPYGGDSLRGALDLAYRNRPDKIVYLQSARNRTYGEFIDAVDLARGAGARVVAFSLPWSDPSCRRVRRWDGERWRPFPNRSRPTVGPSN